MFDAIMRTELERGFQVKKKTLNVWLDRQLRPKVGFAMLKNPPSHEKIKPTT